jgi:hypothetical protein
VVDFLGHRPRRWQRRCSCGGSGACRARPHPSLYGRDKERARSTSQYRAVGSAEASQCSHPDCPCSQGGGQVLHLGALITARASLSARGPPTFLIRGVGIQSGRTEQTGSYSIEIKNEPHEQLAIFAFADMTRDELQTILAEFRRVVGDMGAAAVVDVMPPARVSGFASGRASLPAAEPNGSIANPRRSMP